MPPLVSIIINNYNYDSFLREAIDSALAQTYPNVEVIVVDDGSTDGSRESIASYGDRIIPVLKENGGQASAFNAGFAASKGELIFLLDSDDFFFPDKVATVQGIMSKIYAGRSVLLYHLLDEVDGSGKSQGGTIPPHVFSLGPNFMDYARKYAFVPYAASPTSGLAMPRSLARQMFPIPEVRTSADDFVVCAGELLAEVHGISDVLGAYRIHSANNWFHSGRLKSREFAVALESYLNCKLEENKLDPIIDFFGSPRNLKYAEGSYSGLSRLGWVAVKRHQSPGMFLFFVTAEFKALKCLIRAFHGRVRRFARGGFQSRLQKVAIAMRGTSGGTRRD